MAFQKSFLLPNGVSGNYVRLAAYTWDRSVREASAHFALFLSAGMAQSAPDHPLVPILAKLRLKGDKFDQWLGTATLEGENSITAQLYAAAKVEPVICDTAPAEGQVSVFSNATEV